LTKRIQNMDLSYICTPKKKDFFREKNMFIDKSTNFIINNLLIIFPLFFFLKKSKDNITTNKITTQEVLEALMFDPCLVPLTL
jgi:uncharacterized membrane protein